MKNILLLLLISLLFAADAFAQSDIRMRFGYGAENAELQSILNFEQIAFGTTAFAGVDLKDKDYQISIKEFTNGKLKKTDVVFDSKEDAYFKIKSDKFRFRVLAKATSENTVKFDFQFDGFRKAKEYRVAAGQKEFALKSFLGNRAEITIPLNTNTYILTYMLPYVKKDGSTAYCEVAQSGVNPEELGTKYAIPTYFLIDIKFQ